MIRYQTNPRYRERILLAMAVFVVLALYFLTLNAFADVPIQNEITIGKASYQFTFNRYWPDHLIGIVFAAMVYLAYFSISRKRRRDFILFPVIVCLTGLGLVQIMRLGYDQSDIGLLVFKQILFIAMGLIVFSLTIRLMSFRLINRLSRFHYLYILLGMILIGVTIAIGAGKAGRSIAIDLKIIQIMPVEFVKILVVFFAASFFGRRGVVNPLGSSSSTTLPYALMIAVVLGMLVIQKDLGPLIIMFSVLAVMYGTATGRWYRVALAGTGIGFAGIIAYMTKTPSIVRTRFDMFLNPFTSSDQTVRALWAQCAGNIPGTGWGQGSSFRIAEVQSDFNFVVFAEELGYIGAAIIIVLYMILALAGLRIAMSNADPFRRLLATGLSTMIFIQAFVIIAGDTALLPLTGITLPFVSYGGSSLLSQFLIGGILYRLACADTERFE